MGFFDRLWNILRGRSSLFARRMEENHPDAVFESAINGRKKKREELIKAVSNIVFLRNKVSEELKNLERERADIDAALPRAVEQGDDATALTLIQREEAITARVSELKSELAKVSAQADEAKAGLAELEQSIHKLMREKEAVLAARETAEARISVQETLSELSVEADVQALDSVRESVHKLQAEADVRSEIKSNSVESTIARSREAVRDASAAEKLAEMKRQLAARQSSSEAAAAVKKTL